MRWTKVAWLLAILLPLLSSAGCGTRQHFPNSPTVRIKIATPSAFTLKVDSKLVEAVAMDSVFIVDAQTWQVENPFGTVDNGVVTTNYKLYVAAEGEVFRTRWTAHFFDSKPKPLYGDFTANGTLLAGYDATIFNIWHLWRALPPAEGSDRATITCRDDRLLMRWDELLATGHDPTTSQFDFDLKSDQTVFWATTSTNLVDLPGAFEPSDASWRTSIFSKQDCEFVFRPMFSDGALIRQGVYVRQPDGSLLHCVHLINISTDPATKYFMYSIIRAADGLWRNNGSDNRYSIVEFGGMSRAQGQNLVQQARAAYEMAHPLTSGQEMR